MDRLELPETGQVFYAGHAVGEGLGADVTVGDEVSIGEERWRVEEIVEDPVNRRGHVTLARVE
jgi:hypothetical protein